MDSEYQCISGLFFLEPSIRCFFSWLSLYLPHLLPSLVFTCTRPYFLHLPRPPPHLYFPSSTCLGAQVIGADWEANRGVLEALVNESELRTSQARAHGIMHDCRRSSSESKRSSSAGMVGTGGGAQGSLEVVGGEGTGEEVGHGEIRRQVTAMAKTPDRARNGAKSEGKKEVGSWALKHEIEATRRKACAGAGAACVSTQYKRPYHTMH